MLSKKMKQTLSLTLALFMTGGMAACGDDSISVGDGQTLVKISPFNGGYGLAWLDALTAEYKKEHPEVVFSYNKTTVDRSTQVTAIRSGVADADLYFTSFAIHHDLYKEFIVNLNDVYALPVGEALDDGETAPIGDKLIPSVKEWYTNSDGNIYAVPWASTMLGIIYHKNFFATNQIQVPRTTNELLDAAKTITTMRNDNNPNTPNTYAFSYSAKEDLGQCYWDYMLNPWIAQYEGVDNYEKYLDCKLKDGTQYDMQIASEYKGILRTLEVYEELLKPSNEYNHRLSKDDDFTQAQFRFLDGQAQMMVNGDWIIQEMEKGGDYEKEETEDVAFMKTPIISSIVETMPMWNEASNVQYTVDPKDETGKVALSETKKATYEAALVAIIEYVDGVTTTAPTNVEGIAISEGDIARIREARNLTPTMADNHVAVIPKCSKNISIVKDFLKFMYSDKGIELYAKNIYGTGLPVQYTPDKVNEFVGNSAFLKSSYDMIQGDKRLIFYSGGQNPVFVAGGLKPTYRTDAKTFVEVMTASAETNWESAYTFYKNSQLQIIMNWDNIIDPGQE